MRFHMVGESYSSDLRVLRRVKPRKKAAIRASAAMSVATMDQMLPRETGSQRGHEIAGRYEKGDAPHHVGMQAMSNRNPESRRPAEGDDDGHLAGSKLVFRKRRDQKTHAEGGQHKSVETSSSTKKEPRNGTPNTHTAMTVDAAMPPMPSPK